MTRYFVRCTTCLSVSAIDEQMPHSTQCGLCAGSLELMGRVERDRLVKDEHLCPCDDRCTSARGPFCSCHCGGKNHGKNVVVHVTRDAGPVPTITPRLDREKAAARATEYRAAIEAARTQLDSLLARRRASEFLPRTDFDRMRQLQAALRKAYTAREHKTRMRALYAVVTVTREPQAAERNERPIVPTDARQQITMF